MSSKRWAEKGAGQPKKEQAFTSTRMKPEELPKISREWEDRLAALKEYFRANFQDLESISAGQMLLMTIATAYITYPSIVIDESLFEGLDYTKRYTRTAENAMTQASIISYWLVLNKNRWFLINWYSDLCCNIPPVAHEVTYSATQLLHYIAWKLM